MLHCSKSFKLKCNVMGSLENVKVAITDRKLPLKGYGEEIFVAWLGSNGALLQFTIFFNCFLLLWSLPLSAPHATSVLLLAPKTHWSFHTYYREHAIYMVHTRLRVYPIHTHMVCTHEKGNHIISLLIRQGHTLQKIKVVFYDTSLNPTPHQAGLGQMCLRDSANTMSKTVLKIDIGFGLIHTKPRCSRPSGSQQFCSILNVGSSCVTPN